MWKIDCDALSNADWECLAHMAVEKLGRPFGAVRPVPTGGYKLADHLRPFVTRGPALVVDDVLTTGASFAEYKLADDDLGLVVFARGKRPEWVVALFQMPPSLV